MIKLNVLYEDNHVLVVVKPPNILSQKDSTGDDSMVEIVKKYLKEKYQKPGNVYLGLVHRLDRPVSGIMVFAKTSKASKRLTECFKKKMFKKNYLAIVKGKMEKEKDTLKDYIGKDENGNAFIKESGKEAILDYEVLEYNEKYDCSLVKVLLHTGRHHQIRLQFASRGHFILGDQRYGEADRKQICLFAYSISFPHPITKEFKTFSILPENKGYWTRFTL